MPLVVLRGIPSQLLTTPLRMALDVGMVAMIVGVCCCIVATLALLVSYVWPLGIVFSTPKDASAQAEAGGSSTTPVSAPAPAPTEAALQGRRHSRESTESAAQNRQPSPAEAAPRARHRSLELDPEAALRKRKAKAPLWMAPKTPQECKEVLERLKEKVKKADAAVARAQGDPEMLASAEAVRDKILEEHHCELQKLKEIVKVGRVTESAGANVVTHRTSSDVKEKDASRSKSNAVDASRSKTNAGSGSSAQHAKLKVLPSPEETPQERKRRVDQEALLTKRRVDQITAAKEAEEMRQAKITAAKEQEKRKEVEEMRQALEQEKRKEVEEMRQALEQEKRANAAATAQAQALAKAQADRLLQMHKVEMRGVQMVAEREVQAAKDKYVAVQRALESKQSLPQVERPTEKEKRLRMVEAQMAILAEKNAAERALAKERAAAEALQQQILALQQQQKEEEVKAMEASQAAVLKELEPRRAHDPECPLCFIELADGDHFALVPCGHSLCSECTNTLLHGCAHPTCPLCKVGVTDRLRVFV